MNPRHARDRIRSRRARQKSVCRLALVLCLGIAANPVAAVTCSTTTTGVAFGAYDVFTAGATNTTGNLQVTCSLDPLESGPVTAAFTLSMSTGSSNSFVQRHMVSGINTLGYNLYTANNHAVVWGDGTGATATVSGSIKLTNGNPSRSENKTVYGQVPALQDVAVSPLYADTIVVTTTY